MAPKAKAGPKIKQEPGSGSMKRQRVDLDDEPLVDRMVEMMEMLQKFSTKITGLDERVEKVAEATGKTAQDVINMNEKITKESEEQKEKLKEVQKELKEEISKETLANSKAWNETLSSLEKVEKMMEDGKKEEQKEPDTTEVIKQCQQLNNICTGLDGVKGELQELAKKVKYMGEANTKDFGGSDTSQKIIDRMREAFNALGEWLATNEVNWRTAKISN